MSLDPEAALHFNGAATNFQGFGEELGWEQLDPAHEPVEITTDVQAQVDAMFARTDKFVLGAFRTVFDAAGCKGIQGKEPQA